MLSELVKSVGFWGIIGVILGYALGEGTRLIRYHFRISKLKRIILEELKSIQAQIPQKKDLVKKMIGALQKEQMLGGISVGIVSIGYRQHIGELYEYLGQRRRDCLHVIHERLKNADDMLSSFENDFTSAVQDKVVNDPFAAYAGRLSDILENYDCVEKLIESYLEEKPTDVFYIESGKFKKL